LDFGFLRAGDVTAQAPIQNLKLQIQKFMKRPWQVWLVLAACGVVVAAAMAWLTLHALRADRERTAARADADLEQRISLALWRMDTKLAPLIAEESARPHFYYTPFITVETPRSKAGPAEELAPSPLLNSANASVLLNFNATASGEWTSPQAPQPEWTALACANGMTIDQIESNRDRLGELAASVTVTELLAQLPEQPLPRLGGNQPLGAAPQSAGLQFQEQNQATFYDNVGFDGEFGVSNLPVGGESAADQQAPKKGAQIRENDSLVRSNSEFNDYGSRGGRVQEQVGQEYVKQRAGNVVKPVGEEADVGTVVENVSRPLWVGDRLLLARRVVRDGVSAVQGSWLNWPQIKRDLLAETADLLPDADLAPVHPGEEPDPTRMMAGLPVRLIAVSAPATVAAASPLKWALGVGWLALGLALVAVAGLLWGVMALSERRAAFVSSVTHELRTPLTTFRMYAEMLVRDMVPSAERRREYLETLRTEAERLTHLVDNVLAYARLERGRKPRRSERTTPAKLVARFEPRLVERAGQSGMALECAVAPEAAGAALLTDVGVVEQILFNLVDNAAKYAARANDRRVHLEVVRAGEAATFTVRDHGPGFVSPQEAARSAPFNKSAEEAAESAPGVGLGLALCRRLARELGGRLEIAASNGPAGGAAVTLHLPVGA
jgi:signal transduction histidine kinase